MAIKIAKKEKLDNGVKLSFVDKGATALSFGLDELSEEIVKALAIHGLSQKLGDSYSSIDSITEAITTVKSVWQNLLDGNFNARVSGSGLLAEAIARIQKITTDEAATKLGALSEEKLEALKANVKIKAMMTVIRGERAAAVATNDDTEIDLD